MTIDDNVPLPPPRQPPDGITITVLLSMKVGQSVVDKLRDHRDTYTRLSGRIRICKHKARKIDRAARWPTRKVDGGYRVWRAA
jgi:hypothetical protein